MSFQKPFGDRCDLGFDNDVWSSKTTTINQGKINFVPPVCLDNPSSRNEDKGKGILDFDRPKVVDKGKNVRVPLRSKVEGVNPPRRQPSVRSFLKCYHCSKMGHMRPYCYKLRSSQPKRGISPPMIDLDKLILMIKDVVSRLDKLEGSQDVPRKMHRRRAATHLLKGSDERLTYVRCLLACIGLSLMHSHLDPRPCLFFFFFFVLRVTITRE